LQSGLSGTGFAENIRNIGSPHQDKNTQSFSPKLSAKRSEELLKLNRYQASQITGLLTGHYLKGRLFKLRTVNSPMCRSCHEKEEAASHVLCDCEALARLGFRYLGMYFTKPSDYHEVLLNKILHYIDGAGLLAE
jgi:hypothetical protein